MKKTLLLVFLLLLSTASFSQEKDLSSGYIHTFLKNNLYIKYYKLIETRFEKARIFKNGLAVVQESHNKLKWGYINTYGKYVIEPQFDEARDFSNNNLAAVKKIDKWGFINTDGKYAIEPKFNEARDFSNNNLAAVEESYKWGIINAKGKYIIEPQFDDAKYFSSEGLFPVKISDKWGFTDENGNIIIKPQFDDARIFNNNGLAAVKKSKKWGFIDKNGNIVIKPQFDSFYGFDSNGLAAVEKSKKWGFSDKNGNIVIKLQFDDARNFNSNGLAAVKKNNDWGFIDTTGKFVVEPQFDDIGDFNSNGLIRIYERGKFGYINDTNGKIIIEPQFDWIGDFHEGLAVICRNKKDGYGYVDKNGKIVINPQFIDAKNFSSNGLAPVRTSEGWGYIDTTGNYIIEPQFEDADIFSDGLAPVHEAWGQGNKWGYIKEYSVSDKIKEYVTDKVNQWQTKSEMEKTIDYQARVNNQTRSQKIEEYTKEAMKEIISNVENVIIPREFELGSYDADHETFLIHSKYFGNFAISVPPSEVSSFKQNWIKNMSFGQYDFHIEDNNIQLTKLSITNCSNNKKYNYDNKEPITYSVNNITYNFDPIKIDVIQNKNNQENNLRLESQNIEIGKSDVDINIPFNKIINNKSFAVIIANEKYQREASVSFAKNDGVIFKKYCIQTLGLPEDNVHYLENATLNNIRAEIQWIADVSAAYNEANIIFYYAGHGIPDEDTKAAYLLPADGYSTDITTAYKIEDLYDKLGASKAQKIIIFMDACFSGSQRGEGMLTSARGVNIKTKQNIPSGNIIAFSATKNNETAYPYNSKVHGLFTYYLLKKLQQTRGDVTLGNLNEYILTNVQQQSIIVNRKSQTPTVIPSINMMNKWKNLELK